MAAPEITGTYSSRSELHTIAEKLNKLADGCDLDLPGRRFERRHEGDRDGHVMGLARAHEDEDRR